MSPQWRKCQHWAKGLRTVGGSKTSWRGLGLIKPSITDARIWDETMSKPLETEAYANQRLNLATNGKAHGRKATVSNRT
jgi:hypothetical protein